MFPGMITGSCTASVLGTGALVAPILMQLGMPIAVAGAVVTAASVYGMIAPPVNIAVMIIGGGIDLPYVGFDGILAAITFPLAILTTLAIGYRYVDRSKLAAVVAENRKAPKEAAWTVYIPLLVVIALMVGPKTLPEVVPRSDASPDLRDRHGSRLLCRQEIRPPGRSCRKASPTSSMSWGSSSAWACLSK